MVLEGGYWVWIDRERCIKCQTCVRECPRGVLAFDEKAGVVYVKDELRCVGCRICMEKCPVKCIYVRNTQPERLIRGVWTVDVVEDIHHKALTGKYTLRGYGTARQLPNFDDLVVVPAQLAPPAPLDKYREACDVTVVIGEGRVSKPLRLQTPIMIAAMSFGATSREFKLACAKAANLVGTAHNSGEGGAIPEEYEYVKPNGYYIVQFASGRWGVNLDYLVKADGIEVKIGQGAKPGMGGHLLGEKVTEAISKVRGLPVGTDALSPARFYDALDKDDLKKIVQILRDVVDYEKPIIIKLGPGRIYKDVKIAAEADVDAIAIDGMEGGTGCSPEIAIQHAGIPTIGVLPPAVKALKDAGVYGDIKLILLGGIRNGADVYKALALGADAVAVASAIEVAAGSRACFQCYTGRCPYGITSQDPALRKRLNVDKTAERIANWIHAATEEVKILTMLSGHTSIKELSREDLRAITVDAAAITGVKLIGIEDYVLPQWERYFG